MSKRLIVPVKATIAVLTGTGTLTVPEFAGYMRYLVIEGPGPTAKGRVRVRDSDVAQDIYRDPRKVPQTVDLEFYHQAMAVPLNGPCQIIIDNANVDGNYTAYYALEERPTRV